MGFKSLILTQIVQELGHCSLKISLYFLGSYVRLRVVKDFEGIDFPINIVPQHMFSIGLVPAVPITQLP